MQTVRQWLAQFGLAQYAEVFERNAVDLDLLCELTDEDLEKVGVHALGHRKKLLKAIAELKGDVAPIAPPIQQSPPPQEGTSSQAERRQLTVMFCDLVGSTALSQELDPEELRDLMQTYQRACGDVVARYEGHVAQYLGDGLMVYFGWPRAHEDDAVRAIRAGLEVAETVSKLSATTPISARVGIHTGLVVVGDTGHGDASVPKAAVGETPNIAARLQGLAEPGSVVVSERTRGLAGGLFDYADLGTPALKGVSEPLHLFRVVGARAIDSRFEAARSDVALTPLVGREEEIWLLMRRWQEAKEGEGQVVLVGGEPGIGKSRILSALREELVGQGVNFLRFQCSPYYTNSAFYPSIDNLERALQFGRDETADSKLDKLEALAVAHYGRPKEDVRFLAAMLSIPAEAHYRPIQMTPQRFKDETLRSLVDLTEAAARRQPSVMLFEDAHWADPTSLELLDLLIDRVKGFRLLILITHRPEFQNRWASQGHVTALNLSKLTKAQSSAMVSRIARHKTLPGNLHEQILTKTDGVPLYVEELTHSILESKGIEEKADRYEYKGDANAIRIPATLRDSLTARLDRNQAMKEVAQMGAVIGREFSYELIQAIAPKSKVELDQALQQLTASGLAFRRGTPPEATYTFKHVLVQDAAYDSLLKSRRQELHERIAHTIESRMPQVRDNEPEMLAQHYTGANMPEQAAILWHRAGSMALMRTALVDAIGHLSKGLQACERIADPSVEEKWQLELLTTRGIAHMAQKGWPAMEVGQDLSAALPLARKLDRRDLLVPILGSLFWNKHNPGPVHDSLSLVEEAFHEAEARRDRDLELLAHTLAVSAKFWLGEIGEVVTHTQFIQEHYEVVRGRRIQQALSHDPKNVAQAHCTQALWMLGYPDRAMRLYAQNNEHALCMGNAYDYAFGVSFGAFMLAYRRDAERLNDVVERMVRLAHEQRLPVVEHLFAGWVRCNALRIADLDLDHIRATRTIIDLWTSIGGRIGIPFWRSQIALALCRLGHVDDALAEVNEGLEQIRRPGWDERVHLAEILRIRGVVLEGRQDIEGAEQSYRESLAWAREQKAKSWELRSATTLAELLAKRGQREDARELLTPIYNWFTEGFDTHDLKAARELLESLS